jgi:hypothetical protein
MAVISIAGLGPVVEVQSVDDTDNAADKVATLITLKLFNVPAC